VGSSHSATRNLTLPSTNALVLSGMANSWIVGNTERKLFRNGVRGDENSIDLQRPRFLHRGRQRDFIGNLCLCSKRQPEPKEYGACPRPNWG
jgi:hypothetical protein